MSVFLTPEGVLSFFVSASQNSKNYAVVCRVSASRGAETRVS